MELPAHRNFFGEIGLTSTSANYIANKAKEYVNALEAKLQAIKFYNSEIAIIGTDERIPTETSISKDALVNLDNTLFEIAQLKTLIAYLREAIKEKERIHRVCKDMKFEHPDLIAPEREQYLEPEDVIRSWSVDKMLSYFRKETVAAVFGKFVHPGGVYSRQRVAYHTLKPVEYKDNGRDTIITYNSTTLNPADVDGMFYRIQDKQREAQSETNSFLHEIELATMQDKEDKDSAYNSKLEEYLSLKKKYDSEDTIIRNELLKQALNLKIVIPSSLADVYKKIKDDA